MILRHKIRSKNSPVAFNSNQVDDDISNVDDDSAAAVVDDYDDDDDDDDEVDDGVCLLQATLTRVTDW